MKDQQAQIPTPAQRCQCPSSLPGHAAGWIHTRPHRAGLQGQLLSHPRSHIDSVT